MIHLHLLLKDAGMLHNSSSPCPMQEIAEGIPVHSLHGPSQRKRRMAVREGSSLPFPFLCNRKKTLLVSLAGLGKQHPLAVAHSAASAALHCFHYRQQVTQE